jgi:hypothetical protein
MSRRDARVPVTRVRHQLLRPEDVAPTDTWGATNATSDYQVALGDEIFSALIKKLRLAAAARAATPPALGDPGQLTGVANSVMLVSVVLGLVNPLGPDRGISRVAADGERAHARRK